MDVCLFILYVFIHYSSHHHETFVGGLSAPKERFLNYYEQNQTKKCVYINTSYMCIIRFHDKLCNVT